MRLKKLVAGITAIACCSGLFAFVPEVADVTYAASVVNNDFEICYDGWFADNTDSELTAVEGAGFEGSRGMKISGRQDPSDSAMSEKGFYIFGAEKYSYSVMVKADKADTFRLTVRWIEDPETEEYKYEEIDTEKADAGEWVKLSGSLYTPDGSYNHTMIITTDSTQDFYFDNAEVSHKVNKNTVNAAPAGKGLKDEFANYFRVGNILNGYTINNSGITGTLLKDCNAIECENETKPDGTMVQNGSTDTDVKVSLNGCAKIAEFCANNGLGFRGHTLVWHAQTPSWFFKQGFNGNGNWADKSTMDKRLESYIRNMFGAFKTQYPNLNIYAYDVCNECIDEGNGGPRRAGDDKVTGGTSAWVSVYGDNSFIEKAFTYARQYAPEGCKLFYNDYNEFADSKKNLIINTILKPLMQKGVLDGMGMQSHVSALANGGWDGTNIYLKAMDDYLSLGCEVQVTELDISIDKGKYSSQDQANKYKAIFEHAVEANKSGKYENKVTLIQIWGPNDANTWISTENAPLLYDTNNQPKLAYTTLINLLPDSEWGDGSNPSGSTPAAPPEPDENGYWFNCGFEGSNDSFTSRGGTTIKSTSDAHYKGSSALSITGREQSWQAAEYSLSPRVFKAGETYSFSAHAMYTTGGASDTFKFTLEYTDASGETQWDEIATSGATKGKWVQLANPSYKLPEGGSGFKIYVETTDTTIDYYVDEVIGAVSGTKIDGEGGMEVVKPPEPLKPGEIGDLNGDGIINVFDLCIAKRGVKSGFPSKDVENAADIDGSGKVDSTDIEYIQKYIVKKIDAFPVVERPTEPAPSAKRTISEYTPVVEKQVVEYDTNDSRQEKPGVEYGKLESKSYYSDFCKREKPYHVLLPAGYTTSKKYPVMYVMHGYWENQDRMIIKGNGTMYTRQIVGNAIAEGAAEEMILVFPYIYSSQTQNDCSGMNDENNIAYDNFDTVLTKELMPLIEKDYSVATGRENTAITGFSMGGRESLNIGQKHPDLFGYIGAICPAPGATGAWKFESEEASPYLIFITAGSNDEVVYTTPNGYHDNFTKNNVPHIWHYVNGGYHGDNSIHAHLYNFVRAAFKA